MLVVDNALYYVLMSLHGLHLLVLTIAACVDERRCSNVSFVTFDPSFFLILISIACPPEHFKSSRSNTEMCRPCPGLSSSPVSSQAVCMCDTGYYRAPSESPSDDCTGE